MRVGEMVVCIHPKDDWVFVDDDMRDLLPEQGEVYQIIDMRLFEDGLYIAIDLDDEWYEAHGFRPVSYGPLPARKIKEPTS